MSIWEYVVPSQETPDEVFVLHCIYCRTRLQSLKRDEFESGWGGPDNFTVRNVVVCPCCGWWYVRQDTQQHIIQEWSHTIEGAHGALKNLDLTNLSIPINEIRLYYAPSTKSVSIFIQGFLKRLSRVCSATWVTAYV